jgi:hypothetical protein
MTDPAAATAPHNSTGYDLEAIVHGLETDGIIACKGAFPREWAAQMHEDILAAFDEAIAREGGAVGRGPKRYYVEIHPEQMRGFVELTTHPWVDAVARAVLGDDYQFVEVGFDVPFPGAMNQPWHRDFPSPPETYRDHRLTSLAFNLTAVDTVPEMGPFEIAPGTQWERGDTFDHGMFPPQSEWPRYEALAQPKLPKMGDISARSALTLHRGTANRSDQARPVLILGVDAAGNHDARHQMAMTRRFYDALPHSLRPHLGIVEAVDNLEPVVQKHTIEGLVMGAP